MPPSNAHSTVPLDARVRAALERSERDLQTPWHAPPRTEPRPLRWFAVGDPQTTRERFFGFLSAVNALGDDGTLADDVGLVCVGDYFDFRGASAVVAREGLGLLRWLAGHPEDRVVLLLGNHDLCRVMELETFDDASFTVAQELATAISAAQPGSRTVLEEEFRARFETLATPNLVTRDFKGFSVAQRALLKQLLLARRVRLAVTAVLFDETPVLMTHAGVTLRELRIIGLDTGASAARITAALEGELHRAVNAVEAFWKAGEAARLDLAPLHVAGTRDGEGGGLLYHRPAHPGALGAEGVWAFARDCPRRFDPSRELPRGLVQVCGHTGHKKCIEELGSWVERSSPPITEGGLRTLTVTHDTVRYRDGIHPVEQGGATMYLIDGEMARETVTHCPLLPLLGVDLALDTSG